jgi:hypothetical protein
LQINHIATSVQYVLDRLESLWTDEEGTFAGSLASVDADLATSCAKLWSECSNLVNSMEEEALEMPEEVRAVHARLGELHHQLQGLCAGEPSSTDVVAVLSQLDEIDALRHRHGGLFGGDVEAPAPGQSVCMEILHHCYELARQAMCRAHGEPEELKAVADKLRGMRNDLRKLEGHKASVAEVHQFSLIEDCVPLIVNFGMLLPQPLHPLRLICCLYVMSVQHHTEADIAYYRLVLGAIASSEAEYSTEWKQSHAEKLLAECLNIVERLQVTCEEMPPAVAAAHNNLSILKRELSVAASSAGPPDAEKLKSWRATVNDIDEARAASGGVFGGEGEGGLEAPAGQVACTRLLKQCYELLNELAERT